MRLSLGTKMSVALFGALLLSILSAALALVSAWHFREALDVVASQGLVNLPAVAELEISLLEQRGLVSSYILDGDKRWLAELQRREPSFHKWLAIVRTLPRTPSERRTLAEIEAVFSEYDRGRDEVVALHDGGKPAAARRAFLTEVDPLYRRAFGLCEDLVKATRSRIQEAVNEAQSGSRRAAVVVMGCTTLTVALGIGLLIMFVRGVVLPLRRMATDVRTFRGTDAGLLAAGSPRDELPVIGMHLQALMSDVEETRGRLMNAEKLASVGKLAACVAHEIRNPLTSLKMRLFAVGRELGSDPLCEEDLRVMSEEITRLEAVITSFLEFARPPRLALEPTSIAMVIDKTIELVRHRLVEKDIRVERQGEEGMPEVTADPQQLRQVFLNLLMNAAEAMGDGGRISLRCSMERVHEKESVVVRVGDTGSGVPPESKGRILEPFYSLKDEGTGLGLTIAAHIVARHGGSLLLESTSPEGTVFAIAIPIAGRDTQDEQDTGR